MARTRGRWPASLSSAQMAAVRRSCQTMARCSGRPVERSKATRVSRWLVMPMAATVSPALGQAGADLGQGGPHGAPDLGGVVLDPAGAGEVLGQLPVGDVGDPGLLVDDQGAHAGRARIDGDDDLGHGGLTLTVRGYSAPGPAGARAGVPAQTIANGL